MMAMNTDNTMVTSLHELNEMLDTLDSEHDAIENALAEAKSQIATAQSELDNAQSSARSLRERVEELEESAKAAADATDDGLTTRTLDRLRQMRSYCDSAAENIKRMSANITAAIDEIEAG